MACQIFTPRHHLQKQRATFFCTVIPYVRPQGFGKNETILQICTQIHRRDPRPGRGRGAGEGVTLKAGYLRFLFFSLPCDPKCTFQGLLLFAKTLVRGYVQDVRNLKRREDKPEQISHRQGGAPCSTRPGWTAAPGQGQWGGGHRRGSPPQGRQDSPAPRCPLLRIGQGSGRLEQKREENQSPANVKGISVG